MASIIPNKAATDVLTRATDSGANAIYFPKGENEAGEEYDARLAVYVSTYIPGYVIFAGWMPIFTSAFLDHFQNNWKKLKGALNAYSYSLCSQ